MKVRYMTFDEIAMELDNQLYAEGYEFGVDYDVFKRQDLLERIYGTALKLDGVTASDIAQEIYFFFNY